MPDANQTPRDVRDEAKGPSGDPSAKRPTNEPVIESASATTRPEDNRSGAAPYVIVAVALVAACVVATTLGSALLSVAQLAVASRGSSDNLSWDYGNGWPFEDDNGDWGDLGDSPWNGEGSGNGGFGNGSRGNGSDESGEGGNSSSGQGISQREALRYDYLFLSVTLKDYVSANDYQGSQAAVSDFARTLAKADEEGVDQARTHIRAAAAATDDETRAAELEQAAKACSDTKNAIASLGLDESGVTGQKSTDIADELKDAQDDAGDRWDNIAKLVAIMRAPDGHTSSELKQLDDGANNKALDASLGIIEALRDSASSK